MLIAKPIKDRIEASSIPEPNSGCWLWLGTLDRHGYGQIVICRADRRLYGLRATQSAHRMSWLCHRGEVPADLCVLHTCDNPACVNPDHLWLGTLQDNSRDCVAKGRHKGGIWPARDPAEIVGATYVPRTKRWQAQIGVNRRNIYLGYFKTQAEASAAYWAARAEVQS